MSYLPTFIIEQINQNLVAGLKHCSFLHLPVEVIQFDEHMFQMSGEKPPPINMAHLIGDRRIP